METSQEVCTSAFTTIQMSVLYRRRNGSAAFVAEVALGLHSHSSDSARVIHSAQFGNRIDIPPTALPSS
jgi:hypothetical protein